MPGKVAIELHNVSVSYRETHALWNIDFSLPEHNMIAIVGPNGSGKTTMLKSVMGLIPINTGFIQVLGDELDRVRSRVAYVPQRGSVDWDFPINVFDTVLMGRYTSRKLFSRYSKEDKEIAMDALRKVQMESFRSRHISQLSGGQQQRVFIARALAQQADLYLLDEPFAGVDKATEQSIFELLQDMRNEGKTILVVHHDLQSVLEYFDWLVMLNTRLIAAGPAKAVFTAENLQKTYGGKLNILTEVSQLVEQNKLPLKD